MELRLKTNQMHATIDLVMIKAASASDIDARDLHDPRQRVWALQKMAGRYIRYMEKHFHPNPMTDLFKQVLADTEDMDRAMSAGTLSGEAALERIIAAADTVDRAFKEFKGRV